MKNNDLKPYLEDLKTENKIKIQDYKK